MNRIIIIGNGFDLSHDLKTSYGDFALHHIKLAYHKLVDKNSSGSKLFSLQRGDSFYDHEEVKDIDTYRSMVKNGSIIVLKPNQTGNNVNNRLFSDSLDFLIDQRWVDFEISFYQSLTEVLDKPNLYIKNGRLNRDGLSYVAERNRQLEEIKVELEKYIVTQVINKTEVVQFDSYMNLFYERLFHHSTDPKYPQQTCFLNFNYTNTLERYTSKVYVQEAKIETKKIDVINIHGTAGDVNNPINFGYGAELDGRFKELRNLHENSILKFVKSYDYHLNSDYQKLLKYLKTDYEVYIFGHSCGQSDGTILHQLLDNPRCKRIKIFPFKSSENFRTITQEISGHFEDWKEMYHKITPFTETDLCPQYSDRHLIKTLFPNVN